MPKIFPKNSTNPQHLWVYVYTNDHEPAHVHVFCGRKRQRQQPDMKIAIGSETERPQLVEKHTSIAKKDAIAALKLVAEHQQEFLEEWHRIHG